MKRDFLSIKDLSASELKKVLKLSRQLKRQLKSRGENRQLLKGKTLAMIFEKPSLRTRASFEIAMTQLGGHAIYLGPQDIQMGKRESPQDIGKVTSTMADAIMARVFSHKTLEDLAESSTSPVVNGLSDLEHPCQILADFLTILEIKGKIKGLKIAYLGDAGSNIAHSLTLMSALMGCSLHIAAPEGYWIKKSILNKSKSLAKNSSWLHQTQDPKKAAKGADVVITDTWISMGNEAQSKKRLKIFPPYQVNRELMKHAKKDAVFLHCLPAYRGHEVTKDIIDGPQSVVIKEAENRLHAQKGLLVWLLTKKASKL